MPYYEYECEKHGRFEKIVPMANREHDQKCPTCSKSSRFVLSAVRLDWRMGVDSDMPTMADRWAKMHEQGAKQRAKLEE